MNKLHITHKQWICFLKWATYFLLFVLVLTLQGTMLSRHTILGTKLNLLPCVIVCVALTEGIEQGGIFALCTSAVWALAGADFGFVSIVVLTAGAIFFAWLCRAFLYNTLLPCAVCCFGMLLLNESCIFLLRLFLGSVDPLQYLLVLLPGVVFSMVGCPIFYYLSRLITKIEA